jgi:hypothetical protein
MLVTANQASLAQFPSEATIRILAANAHAHRLIDAVINVSDPDSHDQLVFRMLKVITDTLTKAPGGFAWREDFEDAIHEAQQAFVAAQAWAEDTGKPLWLYHTEKDR